MPRAGEGRSQEIFERVWREENTARSCAYARISQPADDSSRDRKHHHGRSACAACILRLSPELAIMKPPIRRGRVQIGSSTAPQGPQRLAQPRIRRQIAQNSSAMRTTSGHQTGASVRRRVVHSIPFDDPIPSPELPCGWSDERPATSAQVLIGTISITSPAAEALPPWQHRTRRSAGDDHVFEFRARFSLAS